METRRQFLGGVAVMAAAGGVAGESDGLDPLGRIHIPIGVANALDPLKTFVEAEGSFSPGFASYGIYFWVFDEGSRKLVAPTMACVECRHGLAPGGALIPWSRWNAGGIDVTTEVCSIAKEMQPGRGAVVGAQVRLKNGGGDARKVTLCAALRALGPAGWAVERIAVNRERDALLVNGRLAVLAEVKPTRWGVSSFDDIGRFARAGAVPDALSAASVEGNCSGALTFELTLAAGEERTLGFVCPVLPGRRAARHSWAKRGGDAMVDVAELNPMEGGVLQPDPGVAWYRRLKSGSLFAEAATYWKGLASGLSVQTPDARWGECLAAVLGHASLCMNEGAPDVAVGNYNVFNRDGMYVANMMQKSGRFDLSGLALDYFLTHPFNGRAYPEADNPGQILWALGQQWLFARDERWLARVYPAARKIARMITYYRTTPGPHFVSQKSLDFGDELKAEDREELKLGRCDGFHPEYTQAFDIAGLRAAAVLAEAVSKAEDAAAWRALSESLMTGYDQQYGANLRAKEYGNYSVLWPCRLYPLGHGRGHEQFRGIGGQRPGNWRYFPLATAHQGLLAGNREAGHATLEAHLAHPQMQGWYTFDEREGGVGSASGMWRQARTTWPRSVEKPGENLSVAMPHGWAIAEVWLLMRDSLLFEDGRQLVLLGGVAPEWFRDAAGIAVREMATEFGACSFSYSVSGGRAALTLSGAAPPDGYRLRLPAGLRGSASVDGRGVAGWTEGDLLIPFGATSASIEFHA